MRTVYIVQDSPGKNLLPAKKFGKFQVLLSLRDLKQSPDIILQKLGDRLIDIKENDYVLLIGDPLAIGLTMIVVLDLVNKINVLKWDRRSYKYDVVEVEV